MAEAPITAKELRDKAVKLDMPVPEGDYDGVFTKFTTGTSTRKGTPFAGFSMRHTDEDDEFVGRTHTRRIYLNNEYGVRDIRRWFNEFGGLTELDELFDEHDSTADEDFLQALDELGRETFVSEEVTFHAQVKPADEYNDSEYNEISRVTAR